MHPLLQRQIAGYRLTEFVGAGGMGEVFKASHIETGRLAAVKVLHRPEFAARFRNEAYVQASLNHPNIAALYDFAQVDEHPALIMEWVDGQSLDRLIRQKGRLGNDDAIRIFSQIVEAVAYLHEKGIIHRDLKPSNVRVRPDGQVRLLDFGIAKGVDTPRFTQAGYAVGTSEYMAPEQFRSRVEAKSDIWALGVLLYEMTTGYLPFDDRNPLLLRGHIERGQYTDPRLLVPGLAQPLISIISDCLQTNPTKRPAAAALVEKLNGHQSALVVLSDWSNRLTINSVKRYLLPITIGLGIVGFGYFFTQLPPDEQEVIPSGQIVPAVEKIKVEVINVDYDVQLLLPDGTVQVSEPFTVKRTPGKSTSITIRHQGVERRYVIDPDVKDLYQCYFDR